MTSNNSNKLPGQVQALIDNFGGNIPVKSVQDLSDSGIIFVEDGNHGENRPRQHEFVAVGIPFIRPPDLKDGRIDFKSADCINDAGFKRVRKGIGKAGDIILTHRATVGRIAITDQNDPAVFVTNPGATVWRSLDEDILNQQYLYCYMRSPVFMDQLWANVGNNCTFDYVSLTQQRSLKIPLLPIEEQRKIAAILRGLDKKIDVNRQINQTLEQIAQAIFKSWFVDFDPVKAKIWANENGHDPERAAMCALAGLPYADDALDHLSPEQQQQLATTATLFPDTLEESELGEIPTGWRCGVIGDICKARGGYAFKSSEFIEAGNPVIKIKNIVGNGTIDISDCQCISHESSTKALRFLLQDGDLLMAMTGATVGKIGLVVTAGRAPYLNQRVAKFESDRFKSKISWFLFTCFNRSELFEQVVGNAQGSAQPNISSAGIEAVKLVLPRDALIEAYCDLVDPSFSHWIKNTGENIILAQLRDALLPKLLSGELSVADLPEVADAK